MAYLATSDLKTYLGTTSTADDGLLGDAITAATAEIDRICRTSFEGTTGARYYRADDLLPLAGIGGSGKVLYLRKDLLALGGLTNGDATTIASTDCWLEPRNETPYQYIRLKSNESWSFGTDGEITVSGTWGYSSTAPAPVIQATRELAAYLYRARDAQMYEIVASPEMGTLTIPKGMRAEIERNLSRARLIRRAVIT